MNFERVYVRKAKNLVRSSNREIHTYETVTTTKSMCMNGQIEAACHPVASSRDIHTHLWGPRSKRTQEHSSLQAGPLSGSGGTNGARDGDEGGWALVWEWGNPSLTVTAPATGPTPWPEYALNCTIRLYYKEVEMVTYTSKNGPEHVLYLRGYHTPTVYSYSVVLNHTKSWRLIFRRSGCLLQLSSVGRLPLV